MKQAPCQLRAGSDPRGPAPPELSGGCEDCAGITSGNAKMQGDLCRRQLCPSSLKFPLFTWCRCCCWCGRASRVLGEMCLLWGLSSWLGLPRGCPWHQGLSSAFPFPTLPTARSAPRANVGWQPGEHPCSADAAQALPAGYEHSTREWDKEASATITKTNDLVGKSLAWESDKAFLLGANLHL